jgi:hypothetical protein
MLHAALRHSLAPSVAVAVMCKSRPRLLRSSSDAAVRAHCQCRQSTQCEYSESPRLRVFPTNSRRWLNCQHGVVASAADSRTVRRTEGAKPSFSF